jgi:hypothetical protein
MGLKNGGWFQLHFSSTWCRASCIIVTIHLLSRNICHLCTSSFAYLNDTASSTCLCILIYAYSHREQEYQLQNPNPYLLTIKVSLTDNLISEGQPMPLNTKKL